MFVAKFAQVNSDKFESDRHGNMPFIGEVLAGTAKGTLINGTMFQLNGLKAGVLYACENVIEDYEGKPQVRVQIISEISILDFIALKKECGPAKLVRTEATVEENVDAEA